LNLIVAVDQNWGIGCDGKLLASIPEDMAFFRQKTLGKVVVMGRATLQSLPGGAPLKNRTNIVMSQNPLFKASGAIVCNNSETLLKQLKQYSADNIFIIGGQEIYKLLLPFCKRAYVTKIYKSFSADKHFPNLDLAENWSVAEKSHLKTYNDTEYTFLTYTNSLP